MLKSKMMRMENGPSSPRNVVDFDRERLCMIPSCQGASNSTLLFPWKLHDMLHVSMMEAKEHIVSWLPDGTAFKVHNSDAFVAEILPMFFKQTKYKSFQRQLNLWGFERIQHGPDKGAYYHENFLCHKPSLCRYLTRRSKRASPLSCMRTPISKPPMFQGKIMNEEPRAVSVPTRYDRTIPRRVSDESFRGYEEALSRLGASTSNSQERAEFGGLTFHLLDQDRCEELDLAFKPYYDTAGNHPQLDQKRRNTVLLQELEQGVFGIPKMTIERFECTPLGTSTRS
mmetsp:Transcript_34511/g.81353  ORF Transcript_34511/g.81353 Transcript_34511/m.81353 type:complete len:284 (-) Transcript_34511:56-907(-)|eukprot:CAMPEP_0172398510 /NCGR_PEP_ID=MMETSP1061-20121228/36567_1 /TAXON_ID=37318 /ORGANISM="Pseudo-nitzschia pungens, Strain cf. pungens" /LENGTH=283 /DNA_ID=CAMNT_0013131043 /DNA_START=164 /DNA_END=1015 /DNA_ORIENTATION=+